MPGKPTCETCRFWHKSHLCKRYPKFEVRPPRDWCGEHQPSEAFEVRVSPEALSWAEEQADRIWAKEQAAHPKPEQVPQPADEAREERDDIAALWEQVEETLWLECSEAALRKLRTALAERDKARLVEDSEVPNFIGHYTGELVASCLRSLGMGIVRLETKP